MNNFINIGDIDKKDLRDIVDYAKSQKAKRSTLEKSATDLSISLTDKTQGNHTWSCWSAGKAQTNIR